MNLKYDAMDLNLKGNERLASTTDKLISVFGRVVTVNLVQNFTERPGRVANSYLRIRNQSVSNTMEYKRRVPTTPQFDRKSKLYNTSKS